MTVGCRVRTCATRAVQPASSFVVCQRADGSLDQATSKVALETSIPTPHGVLIGLLSVDPSTARAQPCECELALDLLYELRPSMRGRGAQATRRCGNQGSHELPRP